MDDIYIVEWLTQFKGNDINIWSAYVHHFFDEEEHAYKYMSRAQEYYPKTKFRVAKYRRGE